jgi:Na+/melibiose symporter-like transporter
VFRLGIVEGPFAMIWGVLAGFAYLGYRLDKQRYQAIRRELDERGAQAPSAS